MKRSRSFAPSAVHALEDRLPPSGISVPVAPADPGMVRFAAAKPPECTVNAIKKYGQGIDKAFDNFAAKVNNLLNETESGKLKPAQFNAKLSKLEAQLGSDVVKQTQALPFGKKELARPFLVELSTASQKTRQGDITALTQARNNILDQTAEYVRDGVRSGKFQVISHGPGPAGNLDVTIITGILRHKLPFGF